MWLGWPAKDTFQGIIEEHSRRARNRGYIIIILEFNVHIEPLGYDGHMDVREKRRRQSIR
jgi:hypothetical protein